MTLSLVTHVGRPVVSTHQQSTTVCSRATGELGELLPPRSSVVCTYVQGHDATACFDVAMLLESCAQGYVSVRSPRCTMRNNFMGGTISIFP